MSTRILRAALLLPLFAGLLALGACDDDPTEVEEHFDASGFAIFDGTTEIFSYLLSDGDPPAIELAVGTYDVTIVPLDASGGTIPEEDDPDHEEPVLEVTVDDPSILAWTATGDGPHSWVEFAGTLTALQAGSTTLDLCILHAGHCDTEAANIPVTVTAQ